MGVEMSARKKNLVKMCVHVHERDRIRLELIELARGVSMSAAIRVGIRMLSEHLGIEKDLGEDFPKNI
jgi:hypothetical protein